MALTKAELITFLQDEVRILLHLAGKIEPGMHDYRPTPTQRSVIELVRYLSMMGPVIVECGRTGTFDVAAWNAAESAAKASDLEQTLAAIAKQSDFYATTVGAMSDADLAAEIAPFGETMSRGAFLVQNVLLGHGAYRTQLFCYLKSCGLTDLKTSNLWSGVDPAPVPA